MERAVAQWKASCQRIARSSLVELSYFREGKNMQRNTDINGLLFPVETREIFYEIEATRQLNLLLVKPVRKEVKKVRIPNYKAVVRADTGKVFSIVSNDYRLVTNEEALELAKQCFEQLFNTAERARTTGLLVDTSEMVTFNIIAPPSKSFCYIDLIHKNYTVNIWKQEVWIPYLRVTNSYNKSRALRFDIGFCRKLCDNGVIFERESIEYKFYHTRQNIAPKGEFNVNFEKLKRLETIFRSYTEKLEDYEVPEKFVFPIVCKALETKFDIDNQDREKQEREKNRLNDFKKGVDNLTKDYYRQLGSNAYAVLNIISDIASHQKYKAQSLMIDYLQKRTGSWLENFATVIRSENFDFETYLGDYGNLLNSIQLSFAIDLSV